MNLFIYLLTYLLTYLLGIACEVQYRAKGCLDQPNMYFKTVLA